MQYKRAPRGLSLIEALVGCALFLIVFLAIFATYRLAIELVFTTKAASGAGALVNERMEYIRGLSYDQIGTVGGIPSGTIMQSENMSLNGVSYTLTTLVQYVDSPADGLEAADENGVTADYKNIRVSAHWVIRGQPRSTFALTSIAPNGIETLAAGGTLKINVFNIAAAPVSGATVRIVNASVSPAVDVSTVTGTSGTVWFPGTPPGAGYQVTVSKNGYSSAQTYSATTGNPNPNPGHVAVVDDSTTTLSLEINELGSLRVYTLNPPGPATFADSFSNQSSLSATTSTTVTGGSLRLVPEEGLYPAYGDAVSVPVSPTPLNAWTSFSWNASTSPEATLVTRLYYWNGTEYALVSDEDVPGNAAGLTTSPVSISAISTQIYGSLQMRAFLTSSNPLWTPELLSWELAYSAGATPLPNAEFAIHGARTIGVTAGGVPIYKTDGEYTTTQYGEWVFDPIEADGYTLSMPQGSPYAIAEQCPALSGVAPAQDTSVSLTLVPATAHSVRVSVAGSGNPLSGASVTIQGNGEHETTSTGTCGQVFFSGIPTGTYTVTVSAPGFQTVVDTNVSVSGYTMYSVALTP